MNYTYIKVSVHYNGMKKRYIDLIKHDAYIRVIDEILKQDDMITRSSIVKILGSGPDVVNRVFEMLVDVGALNLHLELKRNKYFRVIVPNDFILWFQQTYEESNVEPDGVETSSLSESSDNSVGV